MNQWSTVLPSAYYNTVDYINSNFVFKVLPWISLSIAVLAITAGFFVTAPAAVITLLSIRLLCLLVPVTYAVLTAALELWKLGWRNQKIEDLEEPINQMCKLDYESLELPPIEQDRLLEVEVDLEAGITCTC